MDDLISRQAAIEEFKKELTEGESHGNYVTICSALGFEGIRNILERLPSAQPDIVRCGECKWWADVDGVSKSVGIGACCCGYKVMRLGFLTTKGWFCADGERRND